jgi:hypothetical protein
MNEDIIRVDTKQSKLTMGHSHVSCGHIYVYTDASTPSRQLKAIFVGPRKAAVERKN